MIMDYRINIYIPYRSMKYCITILFLVLLSRCTDSESACIEDMIGEFVGLNEDRGFTFIYRFEQDGEQYYIFDSGIAFDATASVVNEQCEVVCTYGGFRPGSDMPCDEFQASINDAKQIWPE